MPELPEVETTSNILNKLVKNQTIKNVWTDYNSPYFYDKENIKDPKYFKSFQKQIANQKIIKVYRRAKNVLIELENKRTIVIHMKMTGHLLYGKYSYDKKSNAWIAPKNSPLSNSFSRFIHLIFELKNGQHIAFSDMRKFASVFITENKNLDNVFRKFGPEPLNENFTWQELKSRLNKKPNGFIKTVLMNPEIVVGVGNIYSDEVLWASKIHPESLMKNLNDKNFKDILKNIKSLLSKGINMGGDSMSDYRNPYGEKGDFQNHHNAYRRTNEKCNRPKCAGKIKRKMINQRSGHFCDTCQILY